MRQNEAIQAVLLYGSRSRGDHRRGSDYDIAIVTSLPRKEAFEAAKLLYDGDLEKKYWTEPVFRSPKELERYANTAGTLESRLAREGVLIAGEWTRPECREGTELDIEIEKGARVGRCRDIERVACHLVARCLEQRGLARRQ